MRYDIVAIGTSAGGIDALKTLLSNFNFTNKIAIIIVQHLSPSSKSYLPKILSNMINMDVYEIEDKMKLQRGYIYVAPPNYHVMIEKEGVFTLTNFEKVCYARPSIDVTFESISDVFEERVIGVILTGANHDGGHGLMQIKANGGYTIVQDPMSAEAMEMPKYAIEHVNPNEILEIGKMGFRINELINSNGEMEKLNG